MPEQSPIKIFISYGRRDASGFVERLAADLTRAGFQVWRDTDNLQAPNSWEDQIVAALKRSDAVVAVLTPHAVRSAANAVSADNSVCLDELAFARFSPPPTPIVPILLQPCDPPFVIYRLNYIDFLGSETDEVRYTANLERLIIAIKGVKSGLPTTLRKVRFEPLDFDLYLASKTRDYVGREWLVAELGQYLSSGARAPALLVVAEPGWGKTAFAAQLYRGNPDGRLLAAHFCRADRSDTIDAGRFVDSLIAMVAARSADFARSAEAAPDQEWPRKDRARARFERLFLEPLSKLNPSALAPIPRYILIDGLDEAIPGTDEPSIPDMIARTLPMFPPWLRIVATTRERAEVVTAFGAADVWRLDGADPRNRHDIRTIVERTIGAGAAAASQDWADAIETKARGNALCAAQLAAAVRRDGLDARTLAGLPGGLSAVYREILERRFDRSGPEWTVARDVIAMILATPVPLPISLIALAREDRSEYETRAIIGQLSDLLQIHGDAVRLFHQTFATFLADRRSPYQIDARGGAERLADLALSAGSSLEATMRAACDRCLRTWIANSRDPARYETALRRIYEPLFAQEFELYATPNKSDLADDFALIDAFTAIGRSDCLADVVELAMETAQRRSLSAGPTPESPPAYPNNVKYAQAIQAGMWLIEFAFNWIEAIVIRAPTAKSPLVEVWERRRHFFGFYQFLSTSYRRYGISGYYEDEADWLISESGRIWNMLTTAPA